MPPIISTNQPTTMSATAAGVAPVIGFVPIPGAGEAGLVRRDSPTLSSVSGSPSTGGVYMYQTPVHSGPPQYFQTTTGSEGAAPVVYYIQSTVPTSMPSSSLPSGIYHAPFHPETVPAGMTNPVWPAASTGLGDQSTVSAYAVGPLPVASSTVQTAADSHTVTTAAAAPTASGPMYVAQQPMTYQLLQHGQYSPPLHPRTMPLQVFVANSDNPLINSTNMEVVWHQAFDTLFGSFGHPWTLEPAPSNDHDDQSRFLAGKHGVKEYKDSAKVRFHCKRCGKAWTSMKGRVIFWIRLCQSSDVAAGAVGCVPFVGTVQFRLFGQRCEKCKIDDYENAMWYPEEVRKVVWNVWNRVGQIFYNFERTSADVARRTGRPRSQHNSSLCQACHEGICNENRDDRANHISGNGTASSLANRLQQQLKISGTVPPAASKQQQKPQNQYRMTGAYWPTNSVGVYEPLPMAANCYSGPVGDTMPHFIPQAILSC